MLGSFVDDIVKYFQFDNTNIDNIVYKLFYKGCFILFLMGSTVGLLTQYFGDPINCNFPGSISDLANDYCWIHGQFYIPPAYQKHMKCVVDQEDDRLNRSENNEIIAEYYQWVTFVMIIQAGTFMIPYKLWSYWEGGLLEEFGYDARSTIMLRGEDVRDGDEATVVEAVVEKYVKFYKSIFHRNTWYFWKFAFTEFLNFVILIGNFWFMDMFLQGKFWYFGIDVINFSRLHPDEQKFKPNPFCQVFPLETSCTLPSVGAGGGEQETNGLCVLSQNIINQKMYLVLWFWMTFVIIIAPICLMYRIVTIWFDCFRSALLMAQTGNTNDKTVRNSIRMILSKCQLGDWFVLYQLSKNVNMYFFRSFIKELRHGLVKKSENNFIEITHNKLKDDNLSGDKSSSVPILLSKHSIEHEDKIEKKNDSTNNLAPENIEMANKSPNILPTENIEMENKSPNILPTAPPMV